MKERLNFKKITGFIGAVCFIFSIMITPRVESTYAEDQREDSCHAPCTHWTTNCGTTNCMRG